MLTGALGANFAGTNSSRQRPLRTMRNHKRNTFKNLSNQIISFIDSQRGNKICLTLKQPLDLNEANFMTHFRAYAKSFTRKLFTIREVRNVFWCPRESDLSPQKKKYHHLIRILSRIYLEREAVARILTSKAVKNKPYHI
jgi:hypothetical protein